MESTIRGKVYKFGDNVNSDIIIAGRYLIYIDLENLAKHAFEMLGEDVRAEDHSVGHSGGRRNFGCGSAREQATTAIRRPGDQVRGGVIIRPHVLPQRD